MISTPNIVPMVTTLLTVEPPDGVGVTVGSMVGSGVGVAPAVGVSVAPAVGVDVSVGVISVVVVELADEGVGVGAEELPPATADISLEKFPGVHPFPARILK